MQLEGEGEGYETILMDRIAVDEPLYMVNSDEIEVAMIALACEQALLFDDRF